MTLPHTITVVNKVEDEDGNITYKRTVINNVLYTANDKAVLGNNGDNDRNELQCIFPFSSTTKNAMYTPKMVFDKLEDKSNYFTLSNGDCIIKGEYDEDIVDISELRDLGIDCFVIEVINVHDYGTMCHWKIVGVA